MKDVMFMAMLYMQMYVVIMLIILYLNLLIQRRPKTWLDTLFKTLIILVLLGALLDTIHTFMDGGSSPIERSLLFITSFMIYFLPLSITVVWYFYVLEILYHKRLFINTVRIVSLIPAILSLIIIILSLWWPIYYTISKNNIYSRGPLFNLSVIISFLYLILPIYYLIKDRKIMKNRTAYALISFTLFPMIAAIIQVFNYGVFLIGPSLGLAVLMMYLLVQSQVIATDYLTGLFNKREFESFLTVLTKRKKLKHIALIFIDLDDLKMINDTHGHDYGDYALKDTANILTKTFGRDAFIARIGGDEFTAILTLQEVEDLSKHLVALEKNIDDFNQNSQQKFHLSLSWGSGFYDSSRHLSITSFVHEVEQVMYAKKNAKNLV
jgi:diguanylate cyclase (GGDEF)-like protein